MAKVTDKRKLHSVDESQPLSPEKVHSEVHTPAEVGAPQVQLVKDPVDAFIEKVFAFIVNQPEFYMILQADRGTRKRFERAIAKTMTRFPHFKKVMTNDQTGDTDTVAHQEVG